ncbi:hypothetical protein [Algoriphagus namhaensis]
METIVSFILIFGVYFLAALALTQDYIRPKWYTENGLQRSNYNKILGISIGTSLLPAILLFLVVNS